MAGGSIDQRLTQQVDSGSVHGKHACKLNKDDIAKYVIKPVMRNDEAAGGGTGGSEGNDIKNSKQTEKQQNTIMNKAFEQ